MTNTRLKRRKVLHSLALLAVITFIGAAVRIEQMVQVTDRQQVASYQRGQTIEAVRNYLVGVEEFLPTSDATLLRESMAPSLTDHTVMPGSTNDAQAYNDFLAALIATAPGAQVEAAIVSTSGDFATLLVRVYLDGHQSLPAAPGQIAKPEWLFTEQLQVLGGKITDRRGPDLPFTLESYYATWIASIPGGDWNTRIYVLATDGSNALPLGSTLFAVQAGDVRVLNKAGTAMIRSGASEPVEMGLQAEMAVLSGDLVLPGGGREKSAAADSVMMIVSHLPAVTKTASASAGSAPACAGKLADTGTLEEQDGLQPLIEIEQSESAQVLSFERTTLVMPTGERLPRAAAGAVQIVTLESGELLVGSGGKQVFTGETLIIGCGADDQLIVSLAPSAIDIVTIMIGEAANVER